MKPFIILLLSTTCVFGAEVKSKSGAKTQVASSAAAKFQEFIDWLDEHGYPIKFMGGIRRGRCGLASLHPCGKAIDINQVARGRVIRAYPPGTAAKAASLGIVSGGSWCHSDLGHWQIGGWSGCRVAKVRTPRPTRYATAVRSPLFDNQTSPRE